MKISIWKHSEKLEEIAEKIVMINYPVTDDTKRLNELREDLGIDIKKIDTEELGN